MMNMTYVSHLHKTSLMLRFLNVEFNIPLCRVQSVLQIGENEKSILFLHSMLCNFENSKKHQILKPIMIRIWPLKKKNHISTSFKRTFKMAKILEKSSTIMKNINILKESCPKMLF